MPDASEQLQATLRTFAEYAGLRLSDEDFEAAATAVASARERLAALRNDLNTAEEPAAVFSTPAGLVE